MKLHEVILAGYVFLFTWGVDFFSPSHQQLEDPKFKVTKWSKPAECNGEGSKFETGYVSVPTNEWVEITVFFQKQDGAWIKKRYSRHGSGYVQMNYSDCALTGNHYFFICNLGDKSCVPPSEQEIANRHNKGDMSPRFKVVQKSKKEDCQGFNFEEGYVYSPTGQKVEITLFMEKKDGSWRKKHYTFTGTGLLPLNISDCELTGNYKAAIQYVNN